MLNWREVGGEHLQRPLDDPSFVFRVSASSHTVAQKWRYCTSTLPGRAPTKWIKAAVGHLNRAACSVQKRNCHRACHILKIKAPSYFGSALPAGRRKRQACGKCARAKEDLLRVATTFPANLTGPFTSANAATAPLETANLARGKKILQEN